MQLPGWQSIFMLVGAVTGILTETDCFWAAVPASGNVPAQVPLNTQTAQVVYGNYFYQLHVNGPPPRKFLLYTPQSGPPPGGSMPVVIFLAPQGFNVLKHGHDNWEGILRLAAQERFLVIMLLGVDYTFNVGLNLQPYSGKPNELTYLQEALQHVARKYCIDKRRIFCLGMSNGGRECQHFVSVFHDVSFAAVGLISSVRYPYPNKNLQPVPMIAIHGMDDGIDPYWGGGPEYWGPESVPQAIEEWSTFNGCQRTSASENTSGVVVFKHTQCTNGADIVLVAIEGGGHTQPFLSMNPKRPTIRCGKHHLKHAYVNVTQVLWQFFLEHGAAASSHQVAQSFVDSTISRNEVLRSVDSADAQLPESATQALRSFFEATAVHAVLLLIPIATALVSVTLFRRYQRSRKSVPGDAHHIMHAYVGVEQASY